jgi:hypothetical protein
LDVAAKVIQKSHQPVGRISFEASIDNGRHFGLINAQNIGRLGLSELPRLDRALDMKRQISFRQKVIRVRQAEVREYISAAGSDCHVSVVRH